MFPCWSAFLSRWPFGGTCALVWLGLNGFPMSCHKLTHGGSCVTPLSLKVGELGGRDCSMGPGCPYVVELSVYARGWKFLPWEDFFFPSAASFRAAGSLLCAFFLVDGGNGKQLATEPLKSPGQVPLVSILQVTQRLFPLFTLYSALDDLLCLSFPKGTQQSIRAPTSFFLGLLVTIKYIMF